MGLVADVVQQFSFPCALAVEINNTDILPGIAIKNQLALLLDFRPCQLSLVLRHCVALPVKDTVNTDKT